MALTDCLPTCVTKTYTVYERFGYTWLAVHLLSGLVYFCGAMDMPLSEFCYFTVVTITTVGYGDISPGTVGGKWFVCIWALSGFFLFSYLLGLSVQKHAGDAESHKASRAAAKAKARDQMQDELISHGIDADALGSAGDELLSSGGVGSPASTEGMSPKASRTHQPTLRDRLDSIPRSMWLTLEVGLLFGAGVCVMMLHSHLSFTDAFYFCVITATTIGYGDFTPAYKGGCCDEPTGHAGNWFGVGFCLMSITMLGRVLNAFGDYMAEQQEAALLKDHLKKLELTEDMITELDCDGDGDIEYAEWLKFCIKRLDLVDPAFMAIIDMRFQDLDASGDGILTRDDLKAKIREHVETPKGKRTKLSRRSTRSFAGITGSGAAVSAALSPKPEPEPEPEPKPAHARGKHLELPPAKLPESNPEALAPATLDMESQPKSPDPSSQPKSPDPSGSTPPTKPSAEAMAKSSLAESKRALSGLGLGAKSPGESSRTRSGRLPPLQDQTRSKRGESPGAKRPSEKVGGGPSCGEGIDDASWSALEAGEVSPDNPAVHREQAAQVGAAIRHQATAAGSSSYHQSADAVKQPSIHTSEPASRREQRQEDHGQSCTEAGEGPSRRWLGSSAGDAGERPGGHQQQGATEGTTRIQGGPSGRGARIHIQEVHGAEMHGA